MENGLAYKTQRAWKRYHDAGENLDLLDADDRELLHKTMTFQNHHAKRLRECERAGKMLSPEDQLIVEESKERHDKRAETRKGNTDKKCEVLANQLVDKYGRDASKCLDLSDYTFRSRLGDRKSEFERLPSHGTVNRLWQTLKAKLDLLDNETAIALPPVSEPLISSCY